MNGRAASGSLLLLVACGAAAGGAPRDASPREGSRVLAPELLRFQRDAELLDRFHPFETAAVRARERAFLEQEAARFAAIEPATLARDARVDRELILALVEERLERLRWREEDAEAAAALVPFAPAVAQLEADDRAGRPFDGEAIAASLAAAARATQAARETPPAGEAPWRERPAALAFAREQAGSARSWVAEWQRRNAAAEPLLAFWCTQPAGALDAELVAHARWLDERIEEQKKTAEGNPLAIGRERFAAELRFERIAATPEELLAFGEAQLAALQEEMGEETRRWLARPGASLPDDLPPALRDGPRDWRLGLELAKRDVVPVGGQRLFVQEVAEAAIEACERHALYPIDPLARECWRLKLSDLETQQTLAYGYYGGNFMGVGAALPAMEHERKLEALRSNARPTTRTVVPHELIPGHHLQGFHAQRRPERAPWRSPFFVEGWAVHCEKELDRVGFFRDPRERIGHLFWRLLRAARIIASTRFHLREWTPPQMVDFMVGEAGLERSAAQAEVDRYMTYSPLYQCAYLYGDHLIARLQDECRAAWGAGYSDLRFHGELVAQGSIPIAFARLALLGEAAAAHPAAGGAAAGAR